MRQFLTRLLLASQWGATLVLAAGCTTHVEGGGGGTGGDTGGGELVDPNGDALDPTPETTCEGPVYNDDFGYHGQCCYEVHCVAPADGVCPDAKTAPMTDLPPGSGTCECGTRNGPYQNNDAMSALACCYLVGSIGCDGRPLMIAGEPRLAEVIAGPGAWSVLPEDMRSPESASLDNASFRAVVSRRWAERARYEHASIASFARFSMALLACGAPPALVAASQRAGLDEVRHAQIALAVASSYAGRRLDLGPLDIAGAMSGPMTLDAVAVSTAIEGCVGETLSAIEAAACAAAAAPGPVREALSAIAEDETRHAELAWATVRWAAGAGGPALRAQLAAAFAQALERAPVDVPVAAEDDLAGIADHGFLPAAEVAALRKKAVAEVLRPAAAALLAGARSTAESVDALAAPSVDMA